MKFNSKPWRQLTPIMHYCLLKYVKGEFSATELKLTLPYKVIVHQNLTRKANNFIRYHRRQRRKH